MAEGRRIAVLGDGGWGTALAVLLHGYGHDVRLWSAFPEYAAQLRERRENVKFLPGVQLPAALPITAYEAEALAGVELALVAVPTRYLRSTLKRLRPAVPTHLSIVSGTKGLEIGTLKRPSEVVAEVLKVRRVAVVSGPSHAEEVARGLPASVVVASRWRRLAEEVQELLSGPTFRVYTSTDVVGVELGAAVKNIIAVAAGISDGLGLGDNAKAALLTRGLAEIARLGVALGAQPKTFAGLSGIGDLITTCISPYGRNRAVGEAVGRGQRLADVLAGMVMVAEGVDASRAVRALARKSGVEMPITEQVYQVLFRGKDPLRAVTDLMLRRPKPEHG
jgi:glycerol-3-phosphate dehydrogenase (NAD(P)+)